MGPDIFYVRKALVLGQGEERVDMLLIREPNGRYRRANAGDLERLEKVAPEHAAAIQAYRIG